MDYYSKYLKYKKKYTILKNQLGGSKRSAKDFFIRFLQLNPSNYSTLITNLRRENNFSLPEDLTFPANLDTRENQIRAAQILTDLFYRLYARLLILYDNNSGELAKYDDFIVESYLNNTFGVPSSLENIGRFKDSIKKYNIINSNLGNYPDFELYPLHRLNGLRGLEDYLSMPAISRIIEDIESKGEKGKKKRELELEKKRKGEMPPLFETDNILVYDLQTEDQAKYYGRNTKWCTAANENNMFSYYKKRGNIYVIMSKRNPINKYQLNLETDQLMDPTDTPIGIYEMLGKLNNDRVLLDWLEKLIIEYLTKNEDNIYYLYKEDTLIIKNPNLLTIIDNFSNRYKIIEQIINNNHYIKNENIKKIFINSEMFLLNFINLTHLQFGYSFNQPLGDSLTRLISLTHLQFGNNFNQPLGDSLTRLISLTHLQFGNNFNQPLGDSLTRLSLTHLQFGNNFNQPLGDSLTRLISLTHLKFGNSFNQPLGDSLTRLISLTHLTFGNNFNQPLGNSLYNLTSLTHLTFGLNFNQPLGDSLSRLISLTHLKFGNSFNQPLGDSLLPLKSLIYLEFGYKFNQPLGDSLTRLISLIHLKFNYSFNQPLGYSLLPLKSLIYLEFGNDFNQPLGDSLLNLTSLTHLKFDSDFNQSFGNSLDSLNLRKIILNKFDYKFKDELAHKIPRTTLISDYCSYTKFANIDFEFDKEDYGNEDGTKYVEDYEDEYYYEYRDRGY